MTVIVDVVRPLDITIVVAVVVTREPIARVRMFIVGTMHCLDIVDVTREPITTLETVIIGIVCRLEVVITSAIVATHEQIPTVGTIIIAVRCL